MFTTRKRGWMFWVLSPFLVVFMLLMPVVFLLDPTWSPLAIVVLLVPLEILPGLVFLGFFDPLKFWWAWRGVGAIVFGCCVTCVVVMLVESGGRITIGASEPSVLNAVLALLAFGLPGLAYAIFGRFTFTKDIDAEQTESDEEEDIV